MSRIRRQNRLRTCGAVDPAIRTSASQEGSYTTQPDPAAGRVRQKRKRPGVSAPGQVRMSRKAGRAAHWETQQPVPPFTAYSSADDPATSKSVPVFNDLEIFQGADFGFSAMGPRLSSRMEGRIGVGFYSCGGVPIRPHFRALAASRWLRRAIRRPRYRATLIAWALIPNLRPSVTLVASGC